MFDFLFGLVVLLFLAVLLSTHLVISKLKGHVSIHFAVIFTGFLLMILLASYYVFYKKHNLTFFEYSNYKKQAIDYAEEYDPAHRYEFIRIENQECLLMEGCSYIVKLESISSGDKLDILFRKGRLVPIARPGTGS
ncbi:hypothetical protein ABE504_00430 [Paenibacillus oryzisoli]|uniref:hypothetical protein n=1 Tax=Paenibacillus oryzisoli TaxID=1850517 RepID=UPI003D2BFD06